MGPAISHKHTLQIAKNIYQEARENVEIHTVYKELKKEIHAVGVLVDEELARGQYPSGSLLEEKTENVSLLFSELVERFVVLAVSDSSKVEPVIKMLRELHGLNEQKSKLRLVHSS